MDYYLQILVNSIISGSVYALCALGLALSYSLLRIFNFAQGHLLMAGGYAFYYFYNELEWGVWLSLIGTSIVSIILGLLTLYIFIFPFLKFNPLLVFITTLSLSVLLESAVSIIFGVNVKQIGFGSLSNSWDFGGIYITSIQILICLSALIIFGLVAFILHQSSYGRRIRAFFENSNYTSALGYDLIKTATLVIIVSALVTSLSGILIGYDTNLQPTMGISYTIKAFAALILGGLGNLWGCIIASYIIGFLENIAIGIDFFGFSLPAGYKDAFSFFVIVITLLFKPYGLFGKPSRVV
jgi:branched-chain amino acid transport system permease protein